MGEMQIESAKSRPHRGVLCPLHVGIISVKVQTILKPTVFLINYTSPILLRQKKVSPSTV